MCTSRFLKFRVIPCLILASGLAGLLPAQEKAPPKPERWEQAIAKFEEEDKVSPPPKGAILLIGGSNAKRWKDVGNYFPGETVINRGFGGSHLSDSVYFMDRVVLPYAPKAIILNAGGNDLNFGKPPEEVRDSLKAFMAKIHTALPKTKVYYVAIPATARSAKVEGGLEGGKKVNAMLKAVADADDQLEFVDVFTAFLGADGKPRPGLYVDDGIHFTTEGQKILADLIHAEMKK